MRDRAAHRWLFALLGPHRLRLGLVLAVSLAVSGLALAQPYVTKLIVDDGLLGRRLDLVAWYSALILAAAVLAAVLGAANRWLYVTVSGEVLFALREALFRHLQRLSPAFFAHRSKGDVLARLDGDVAELQRFAVDSLLAAVNASIVLLGTLAVMAVLDPWLTLLGFVALPAQVLALTLVRPRVERQTRALRERSGALSGFFVDNLARMKLVQACAAEERERTRLAGLNRAFLADLRRLEITGHAGAVIPGLLGGMATAAVFLAGGAMVVAGELSVGTLIAFTAYLARASAPVNTLLGLWVAQKRAHVSLQRVMELLDQPPAVEEPAEPQSLSEPARGEIRIEGVRFGFGAATVLEGVEAVIPGGAKVGITGMSGAGKSTLIDLLHRHYDPDHGRILLDGVDLRRLRLGDLRRRIAVVSQDAPLIAGSVADNIRYAAPDASDADVRRAAEAAQMLELGLDTQVGDLGAAVSGGQRQRLAIARAILQDPLVLILDEATAGVDAAAQARIIAAIDRLFAGRTRIVVSHHAEALARVDRLLVLRGGCLEPAA
ncbi:MAG TPA: ABC transporter ATP-binding protein [Azospirillum sp.]|nr:ABC transporter ATP-binding protein [Azospirillum sp.]